MSVPFPPEAQRTHAFSRRVSLGIGLAVSLRGRPVEERVRLSDGRDVVVRVGVPDDPYIAKRELDTVTVEVRTDDDRVLAVVNTVLDADQTSEARVLAREIATGLETGELAPTAGAIEPLADRIPER